jgi:putative peptide zinc metalloprotease protein
MKACSTVANDALKVVFSPLRPDLIFQRQVFKSEVYYVIKDPLSLTYFRLQPEEAYILQLLDGKRNLQQILDAFNQKYPNCHREPKEVMDFCNQLARSGLMNIPARNFVQFASQKPKQMNSIFMIWVKLISKILFFKIPLLDPSPWLGKLVHKIRWAWNPYFVWTCLAFYAINLTWFFSQWGELSAYMGRVQFFSPQSFLLFAAAQIFIKTCHEFGHATTCRRFGGEVHEMGACFICTIPCGYVDASDGWMMRKKSHKIYTTIAGIFVEFMLASFAAYLWYFASPGLFKELMFRAMLIASFNTVMFNMNPLMKFDGYYVLSDLWEIPNLRTKAITYCSYHLQRCLFGYRNQQQEMMLDGESRQWVFIAYAVAAYLYMSTVIYGLSQIFARLLAEYELKEFGLILGIAAQLSFLVSPIIKIVYDGLKPGAHIIMEEPIKKRLMKWGIGLAAIIGFFFILPVHFNVEAQGIVVPENHQVVTVATPGFLDQIYVKSGEYVEAGQILGRLSNPDIETQLTVAKTELENAQFFYQQAQFHPETLEETEALLNYESARLAYDHALLQFDQLTLKSPIAGIVWTKDIERLQGHFIPTEGPIFDVAPAGKFRPLIPITEEQVNLLALGGEVDAHLLGSGESFESHLQAVQFQKTVPQDYLHAFIESFGGPIKAAMNFQAGGRLTGVFIAETAPLQHPHLKPYMRFYANLTGRRTNLASKLWRKVLNMWNLRIPVKNPLSPV